MIILKNTINTQTVFINKRKDIGLKAAVQYYTKAEADEKFQPKGDYVTESEVESYVDNIVTDKVNEIVGDQIDNLNNEIQELETSKQETFEVNQPLYFERDGEDLTLNVNLSDYATKEDLENIDISGKQDTLVSGVNIKTINGESILGSGNINTKYTAGDNISILDSEISWEAPQVQFVNTIFTNGASLKYALTDFEGAYIEKEFPLATTETAGLMSPEDKAKLDAEGSGSDFTTIIIDYNSRSLIKGSYNEIVEAINSNKEILAYLYIYNDILGIKELFQATTILYPGSIGGSNILFLFHREQDLTGNDIHQLYQASVTESGVSINLYSKDYVSRSTYNTKMSEIDTAISDLQDQIGDIATVLDNIQGEVI